MADWIPLLVLAVSLGASGISFVLSRRERTAGVDHTTAESYSRLVADLETQNTRQAKRIDNLEQRVSELEKENKTLRDLIRNGRK